MSKISSLRKDGSPQKHSVNPGAAKCPIIWRRAGYAARFLLCALMLTSILLPTLFVHAVTVIDDMDPIPYMKPDGTPYTDIYGNCIYSSIDRWNGTPDFVFFKEGVGCSKKSNLSQLPLPETGKEIVFRRAFGTPISLEDQKDDGLIRFWLYLSDISAFDRAALTLASNSGDAVYDFSSCRFTEGWGEYSVYISDFSLDDDFDISAVRSMSFSFNSISELTVRIDCIRAGLPSDFGIGRYNLDASSPTLILLQPFDGKAEEFEKIYSEETNADETEATELTLPETVNGTDTDAATESDKVTDKSTDAAAETEDVNGKDTATDYKTDDVIKVEGKASARIDRECSAISWNYEEPLKLSDYCDTVNSYIYLWLYTAEESLECTFKLSFESPGENAEILLSDGLKYGWNEIAVNISDNLIGKFSDVHRISLISDITEDESVLADSLYIGMAKDFGIEAREENVLTEQTTAESEAETISEAEPGRETEEEGDRSAENNTPYTAALIAAGVFTAVIVFLIILSAFRHRS